MGTTTNIDIVIQKLRNRLSEFRFEHIGQEQSVHISTIEMALGLVEFAINLDRKIRLEEVQWFNGGKAIDDILGDSKWQDIADLYYEMIAAAKKQKLIPKS